MSIATKETERDKAEAQRQAAAEAADLLADRLGDELPRFVDLYETASYRFRTTLLGRLDCVKRSAGGSHDG